MSEETYWYLIPQNNCNHENMKKKTEGIIVLDYCPDCEFRFWPKDSN